MQSPTMAPSAAGRLARRPPRPPRSSPACRGRIPGAGWPQALLVSNDPCGAADLPVPSHRAGLDRGVLGVVPTRVDSERQAVGLAAHIRGPRRAEAPEDVVGADGPISPEGCLPRADEGAEQPVPAVPSTGQGARRIAGPPCAARSRHPPPVLPDRHHSRHRDLSTLPRSGDAATGGRSRCRTCPATTRRPRPRSPPATTPEPRLAPVSPRPDDLARARSAEPGTRRHRPPTTPEQAARRFGPRSRSPSIPARGAASPDMRHGSVT
jgi:hypothetical protein